MTKKNESPPARAAHNVDPEMGEVMPAAGERATLEIAAETMKGDLLAALLQEIRLQKKTWAETPEFAQRETISRLDMRLGDLIRKAVELIALDKRVAVHADLESITVKDGVKAVFKVSGSMADRLSLAEHVGRACLIVIADAAGYMAGADKVQPDKDQRSLPTIDAPPKAPADAGVAVADAAKVPA